MEGNRGYPNRTLPLVTCAGGTAPDLGRFEILGTDSRSGPAEVALGVAIARFETGTHLCDLHLAAVE